MTKTTDAEIRKLKAQRLAALAANRAVVAQYWADRGKDEFAEEYRAQAAHWAEQAKQAAALAG